MKWLTAVTTMVVGVIVRLVVFTQADSNTD